MAFKLEFILGFLLILLGFSAAGTPGYADHGDTKGMFRFFIFNYKCNTKIYSGFHLTLN